MTQRPPLEPLILGSRQRAPTPKTSIGTFGAALRLVGGGLLVAVATVAVVLMGAMLFVVLFVLFVFGCLGGLLLTWRLRVLGRRPGGHVFMKTFVIPPPEPQPRPRQRHPTIEIQDAEPTEPTPEQHRE